MLFSLEPQILVLLAFSLVFALSFHEFAHAYVADRFGDPTARMAGRLTVNPMVHLDVFGSLMVLVAGFGYAKPVPVNPRNFRHPRADAFVAAAGPLMNLILGIVGGGLIHLFHFTGWLYWEGFPLVKFLTLFILINFNLCLFMCRPSNYSACQSRLKFNPIKELRRYFTYKSAWHSYYIFASHSSSICCI